MSGMEFVDSGIENFCIAFFAHAKENYFKLMDKIASPNETKRAKVYAQKEIDAMRKSFMSGDLDAYTDAFPSMSSADIWNSIEDAYNLTRVTA